MIYSVIPYEMIFAQDNIAPAQIKCYQGKYFEADEHGARRLLSTNPQDYLTYDYLPTADDIRKG